MKFTVTSVSALAIALAVAGGVFAATHTGASFAGHKLGSKAHITLAQAQVIALKARLGAITDQELEKEGGGSGLRYSFDIKSGGRVFEVGVDARDGRVLENGAEGAHPD
jgi:uncharacterized membrane protein YkoI